MSGTQTHRIYIRSTAERIWAALTDPAENGRYGYGAAAEYELRPGGSTAPSRLRR